MAKSPSDPATPATRTEQSIEDLRLRYEVLNRRKIQAETQRDAAMHRLEELKADARRKYGTDDVASLQQKLDEMIRENAAKRSKYQDDLTSIEESLAEVERTFASANTPPVDGGSARR